MIQPPAWKWLDISDAPKDRTPVLCYQAGVMLVMYWTDLGDHGYWCLHGADGYNIEHPDEPTHFCYLPDPPTVQETLHHD